MSGKLSWSCWASSGLSILGYLHGRCSLLPVRLPAFPGGLHTWHWMWVTPFCFGPQWPRQKLSSNSGLLYIICNQKQSGWRGFLDPRAPKLLSGCYRSFFTPLLHTSSVPAKVTGLAWAMAHPLGCLARCTVVMARPCIPPRQEA